MYLELPGKQKLPFPLTLHSRWEPSPCLWASQAFATHFWHLSIWMKEMYHQSFDNLPVTNIPWYHDIKISWVGVMCPQLDVPFINGPKILPISMIFWDVWLQHIASSSQNPKGYFRHLGQAYWGFWLSFYTFPMPYHIASVKTLFQKWHEHIHTQDIRHGSLEFSHHLFS